MPMLLEDPPRRDQPIYNVPAAVQHFAAKFAGCDPPARPDAVQSLGRMQQQAKRAALALAPPAIVLVLFAVLILVLVLTAFYAFCAKKRRRRSNPALADISPLLYDTYRVKE
jgi:hypothetical protein